MIEIPSIIRAGQNERANREQQEAKEGGKRERGTQRRISRDTSHERSKGPSQRTYKDGRDSNTEARCLEELEAMVAGGKREDLRCHPDDKVLRRDSGDEWCTSSHARPKKKKKYLHFVLDQTKKRHSTPPLPKPFAHTPLLLSRPPSTFRRHQPTDTTPVSFPKHPPDKKKENTPKHTPVERSGATGGRSSPCPW